MVARNIGKVGLTVLLVIVSIWILSLFAAMQNQLVKSIGFAGTPFIGGYLMSIIWRKEINEWEKRNAHYNKRRK